MIGLCDVGPRDGLQNDPVLLAPARRAEIAARLAAAGLRRVEVASFVHPKLVPQMAGAEDVVAALPDVAGVAWSGLVLNRKGLDRALSGDAYTAFRVRRVSYGRNIPPGPPPEGPLLFGPG